MTKGSVDVMITRAITHQKHLVQSGCSTRSTLYIFNTLRIFTKEPIREHVKWECNTAYFSHSQNKFITHSVLANQRTVFTE